MEVTHHSLGGSVPPLNRGLLSIPCSKVGTSLVVLDPPSGKIWRLSEVGGIGLKKKKKKKTTSERFSVL